MTATKPEYTDVVINQPTKNPSRKMEGVIAGAVPGATLGGVIVWVAEKLCVWLSGVPHVLDAPPCVPLEINYAILAFCTASVPIAIGWWRKERAVVVVKEP